MKEKLKVKDLISIGIFSALYIVVMMALVTILGTVPLLYVLVPFVVAIICGTIYLLLLMKVPKTGAIFILSVLMAFIYLGAGWYASLWVVLVGVLTEIFLMNGGHKSFDKVKNSYLIFSTTTIGPYFGILLMKSSYIQATVAYYGQEYADKLDQLTPGWIIIPLIVGTVVAALIGTNIGGKILGKHFKRAGVI